MSDDTGQPTPEPSENPIGEVYEQLTVAERVVVAGAALVLVTWLFGQVLVNHYSVDDLAVPLALGVLAGIFSYFRGSGAGWHSLYPWIVAMAALAIAVLGVNRFLEDLRLTYLGGSAWLWQITYYLAAALLGYGGLVLLRER